MSKMDDAIQAAVKVLVPEEEEMEDPDNTGCPFLRPYDQGHNACRAAILKNAGVE